MVWAITIASFLGIVVVALFIFFIYSQKEQIRKALKEKRAERRIPMEVELELATAHEPLSYEKSSTENTSRHNGLKFPLLLQSPHAFCAAHNLPDLPLASNSPYRGFCDSAKVLPRMCHYISKRRASGAKNARAQYAGHT
jgi:hypothetical protein